LGGKSIDMMGAKRENKGRSVFANSHPTVQVFIHQCIYALTLYISKSVRVPVTLVIELVVTAHCLEATKTNAQREKYLNGGGMPNLNQTPETAEQ